MVVLQIGKCLCLLGVLTGVWDWFGSGDCTWEEWTTGSWTVWVCFMQVGSELACGPLSHKFVIVCRPSDVTVNYAASATGRS